MPSIFIISSKAYTFEKKKCLYKLLQSSVVALNCYLTRKKCSFLTYILMEG